jgi:hypothetical protein
MNGIGVPIGPISYQQPTSQISSIPISSLITVATNTAAKILSSGQVYRIEQEQVGIPEEIYTVKKRHELFHKEMSLASAIVIGSILSVTIAIVVAYKSKKKRR